MLIELKNRQILDLMDGFIKIGQSGIKSNKIFNYAIILTEDSISSHIKAITEIAKPSESYAEYEEKRNDLLGMYGETDKDGKLKLNSNNSVVIIEGKMDEALSALSDLEGEYTEILDERSRDIEEYNSILENDVQVNIEMVSLDNIPDDIGSDIGLLKQLQPMID